MKFITVVLFWQFKFMGFVAQYLPRFPQGRLELKIIQLKIIPDGAVTSVYKLFESRFIILHLPKLL